MKGRPWAVLLAVLILQGVLVGLIFTPAPHPGGDNAGYVSLAYSLVERGSYLELWNAGEPPHTKYPPVFPLLLALPMLAGVKGWMGLKAVPLLSTLLAGLFTFLWVRERGREKEGLALAAGVTLLVAVSDGVLDYSRWILSDPTFLAFTVGALWALERARKKTVGPPRTRWLVAGSALVLLAYFTRSAGLPLAVAVLAWLLLGRWWRQAVGFGLAFAVPALLWRLRGTGPGERAYASEFWLLDPYRPELGRVGPMDMLARMGENVAAYATRIVPEGVVGLEGAFLPFLGIGLLLLALAGWIRAVAGKATVAELFFPLYLALLLLWPVVWSGDRFALPLLPLLFYYAGTALGRLVGDRLPSLRTALPGIAFLVLALPALKSWSQEVQGSRSCAPLAREEPWACYGSTVQEYVAMAGWTARNLPADVSVVTRKPRIFFVTSGVRSQSLPFTTDAATFLETAGERGSRYVTLDRWDGLAHHYLTPVIRERPGAFCYVTGVEREGQVGARLLGILPEGGGGGAGEGEVRLSLCPPSMVLDEPRDLPPVPPGGIPLLVWGVRGAR